MSGHSMASVVAFVVLLGALTAIPASVQSIGVCYGREGDNLPQPSDVVALYKSKNIGHMRLYSPDQDALQALKGSDIQLLLGIANENLKSIASDPSAASTWVQNNIQAYPDVAFRYIAVGNEAIPGDQAQYIFPAMLNIQNALSSAGLQNQIMVSTVVATSVLVGFPPSVGAFSSAAQATMQLIVQFLASNGAPLLANVYPYFSYINNKPNIALNYALFTSPGPVVADGSLSYQNLFDTMVDTLYSALEKAGGANVSIVVSESGWPSSRGDSASMQNARTYKQNLINHVGRGTPKRPTPIEIYLYAMFTEDLKQPQGTKNNFGLFYPNQQPVYPINF